MQSLISVEDFSEEEGSRLKHYLHLLRIERMQKRNTRDDYGAEITNEKMINFDTKE
ncbi:MAG: hypothetical protein FWC89_01555 [Defluviitaleaceae bacterium]|nr:hypothetical protein [Defluviitaleaceae bacterium]